MRMSGARERWIAAAVVGAWATVALEGGEPWVYLAVPTVILAVGLARRRPYLAGALLVVASVLTLVAGAGYGTTDLVPAAAVVLFDLGRRSRSIAVGVAVAAACAVASAMRDGATFEKLAVNVVVFGAMWGFGHLVRARAFDAHRAVADADRVERQDPWAVSARQVAEERSRLAGEALVALRRAVVQMQAEARHAEQYLERDTVARIRVRGAEAVTELRELLILLRDPEPVVVPRPQGGRDTPRWPTDLVLAALVLAGGALLWLPHPVWERTPALVVLYLGAAGAVALRTVAPSAACVLSALVMAPVLLAPPAPPEILLPAGVGNALLAWSIATRPTAVRRAALAGAGVVALAVALHFGMQAVGFVLMVFAVPALAGHAWTERDRILLEAEQRRDRMQSRLDRVAAEAVRAERLRIARDVHDVTSHAVGIMALHASAATALLDKAPADARSALRTVLDAGDAALGEIDELVAALAPSLAPPAAGQGLRHDLEAILSTMRAGGLEVHGEVGRLPSSARLGETVFRVVQESLTNVLRHAPDATALVEVWCADGDYVVRVSDDGEGARVGPADETPGFGLAGLRERVLSCGGSLRARPEPDRGFTVEARLPVSADGNDGDTQEAG